MATKAVFKELQQPKRAGTQKDELLTEVEQLTEFFSVSRSISVSQNCFAF